MLTIRVETVVAAIVDQELRRKGRNKEALHFHFDLGMHYHHTYASGKVETFSQRRGLHLLYHCNVHSTYITVFSAITVSPFAAINKVEDEDWKHEASHDSCWRDIRAFQESYFDMAEDINSALEKKGIEEVAPAAMQEHNSPAMFGQGLYSWVPVEVSKDPNDERNYRKIVKVLKNG